MDDDAMAAHAAIASRVGAFYEEHPYPPPADDLDAYRQRWDDVRRRAESHLIWPALPFRDDRSIFVAGCGTMQALHYAVRWPRARVVAIDVSASAIASAASLKAKHRLDNLELTQLSIEDAGALRETFDYVVCTGVLHHLSDPDGGLRVLRGVLAGGGALNLMVYAPYGRTGVYMFQEYCRRLGLGWSNGEIRDLAETLKAIPRDHPIAPLLRTSPDFSDSGALADALLHPQDRAYAVGQVFEFLHGGGFDFARWVRQAPYLPACGALAATPHAAALSRLPIEEQYAAVELFRGTMVRHSALAYGDADTAAANSISFHGDEWLAYVPIRLPDTLTLRERLPPGAASVLINRSHRDTDLYLPLDARGQRLLSRIDGKRTIARICGDADREFARDLFKRLWEWDQVVFDASLALVARTAEGAKNGRTKQAASAQRVPL